jgi:hypothetical protein
MAFPDYEESAAGGDIVELFLFRYGSEPGEYLAYTNHVEALTVATITYEPVPITREDIECLSARKRRHARHRAGPRGRP